MRKLTTSLLIATTLLATASAASAADFTVSCENGATVLLETRYLPNGAIDSLMEPTVRGTICSEKSDKVVYVLDLPGGPEFGSIAEAHRLLKHIAYNGDELENGKKAGS